MSDEELVPEIEEPAPADDDFDPDEPREGSKMSPYAIAAFATGIFALWSLPQAFFYGVFRGAPVEIVVRSVLGLALPIVVGAVALWLATLGEDEIDAAEGRLRGWSLCRVARFLGITAIVIAGGVLILGIAFPEDGFVG